ncbi:MAG: hypothetical protein JSS65_01460 [Armatimonadetes bacterium]|nr:hypothetical protein [Armatimonadota bacterium]
MGDGDGPYVDYPRANLPNRRLSPLAAFDSLYRTHNFILWLLAFAAVTVAVSQILKLHYRQIQSEDLVAALHFTAIVNLVTACMSVARAVLTGIATVKFNRATERAFAFWSWIGFVVTLATPVYSMIALCLVGVWMIATRLRPFGLKPIGVFYRKLDYDYHRLRLVGSEAHAIAQDSS